MGFLTADIPDAPEWKAPPLPADRTAYYDLSLKNQDFLNSISMQQLGIGEEVNQWGREDYERWKSDLKPVELEYLKNTKEGINPEIHVARVKNAIMTKFGGDLRKVQEAYGKRGIKAGGVQSVAATKRLQAGTSNMMGVEAVKTNQSVNESNRNAMIQAAGIGRGISSTAVEGAGSASSNIGRAGETYNNATSGLMSAMNDIYSTNDQLQMQQYNLMRDEDMNNWKMETEKANAEAATNTAIAGTVVTVAAVAIAVSL